MIASPSPTDADDGDDSHSRQHNELDLLASMYGPDFQLAHPPPPSPSALSDAPHANKATFSVALAQGTVLWFELPRHTYPTTALPHAFLVFAPEVVEASRRRLRQALRDVMARMEVGTECCDLVVEGMKEVVESGVLEASDDDGDGCGGGLETKTDDPQAQGLRVVLWMHHLLATSKRKAIVTQAAELGLAGFSKPGYPGAVYVEGPADRVREFVAELKTMRWQAIQERATEAMPLASLRLLGSQKGVAEVSGLADMADGLRKAYSCNGKDCASGNEAADFFLAAMKIK